MHKTLALAKRILLQFIHDPRTMLLLFVAPLAVLWLLSVLLGSAAYVPRIATVSLPKAYQQSLERQDAHVSTVSSDRAQRLLRDNEVDAVLRMGDEHTLDIWAEGSDTSKTAAVAAAVTSALSDMQGDASSTIAHDIAEQRSQLERFLSRLPSGGDQTAIAPFSIDLSSYMPVQHVTTTYLHGGKDWEIFDFYGPVFIGIFLFMFTFVTSGMSLVTERASGTMSRFLATPIHPLQVLGGYTIGFGVLTSAQVIVILVAALGFIGFPNVGNVALIWLMAVSLALVSVTLGLLVSGLARNAFQVIQLILLFVVPQILLCGLFDLSTAPTWLQAVSKCLPLTYGVHALRDIMLRGAGLPVVRGDFVVVWGFIIVFFALSACSLRKPRARRGGQ